MLLTIVKCLIVFLLKKQSTLLPVRTIELKQFFATYVCSDSIVKLNEIGWYEVLMYVSLLALCITQVDNERSGREALSGGGKTSQFDGVLFKILVTLGIRVLECTRLLKEAINT